MGEIGSQIVKIVMKSFFTALSIEGNYRVLSSLVGHVLCFQNESDRNKMGGSLGTPLSSAGNLSYLNLV
jgi:hypothetical protein